MTKRPFAFAVIVAAIGVVLAGVAAATPPFGIISNTIVARAAFLDRVNLRFAIKDDHHGRESIHVRNAADTAMQQIVFAPNGHTGWHSHPGPAVALVISGELTIYSGMTRRAKAGRFPPGKRSSIPARAMFTSAPTEARARPSSGSLTSTCPPERVFGSTPRLQGIVPSESFHGMTSVTTGGDAATE